jgi:hypothetical protein
MRRAVEKTCSRRKGGKRINPSFHHTSTIQSSPNEITSTREYPGTDGLVLIYAYFVCVSLAIWPSLARRERMCTRTSLKP